jgi:hypothetical protein
MGSIDAPDGCPLLLRKEEVTSSIHLLVQSWVVFFGFYGAAIDTGWE